MSVLPSLPEDSPESRSEDLSVGAGFDFSDPNSPLASLYLRTSHVVVTILLALVLLLINYVPLGHTDVWGHLKFGQWIVANRSLPEKDPFCPFAEVTSGLKSYWLSDTGMYLLYQAGERLAGGDDLERMAGGVALLRFGHSVLVVLRYLLLFLAFRRVSGSPGLATAGLALMLVLGIGNIAILRPQVLAELLFACLLLALSRPVLSWLAVVVVPLLMVFWANSHGSFPCGLALLGVAAVGRALDAFRLEGRWQLRGPLVDVQLRRLLVVLLLSVVGIAVLNPLGPGIYQDILSMASNPNVLAMDEWQPIRFHLGGGGQWAYLVLVVLLLFTQMASRRWFSASTLLLIIAFGVPPLYRQRMFAWWLMVAPWIMVRYGADCGDRLREWFADFNSVPSFRKTVVAAMLVLLMLVWSIPGQWLISSQPTPIEQAVSLRTPWPITHQLLHPEDAGERGMPELQKQLAAHYPQGQFRGTIFASETLGDLFIWDLAPRVPVFIYSHVHLFDADHWHRCLAVRIGSEYWRKVLDAYRVNLVVIEPEYNARLCALIREDRDWQVLVDEGGIPAKPDPRQRLFVALRNRPR